MNISSSGRDHPSCRSILPGGKDVYLRGDECEIQVDISVAHTQNVAVWGYVVDCHGNPIENALVKLLRYVGDCSRTLEEIHRTRTDCNGVYRFELQDICSGRYRIAVSKCADEKPGCPHPCDCCRPCPPPPCPPPCPSKCYTAAQGGVRQHQAYPSHSCRTTVYNSIRYQ